MSLLSPFEPTPGPVARRARELARIYVAAARDAFRDAANWTNEARTDYLAARIKPGPGRDQLMARAWHDLEMAARADCQGQILLSLARRVRLAAHAGRRWT